MIDHKEMHELALGLHDLHALGDPDAPVGVKLAQAYLDLERQQAELKKLAEESLLQELGISALTHYESPKHSKFVEEFISARRRQRKTNGN